MGLKVAIVGLSPSHDLAPWNDSTWQKWGIVYDPNVYELDRVFEIHDIRQLKGQADWPWLSKRMQDLELVYVQHETPEIPNGVPYPLEEVSKISDYLCSSIAYMTLLAIHEGASEIAIWGVDMKSGEEYGYQKANMEYLIGLARGRGITVHVPDSSPLLKFNPVGIPYLEHVPAYVGRYGWMG